MTDAFECDRCGELNGGPPELKVATNVMSEVAGSVNLERREKQHDAAAGQVFPSSTLRRPNATYTIKSGDLCEDCADAFREFWGESDD